LIIIDTGPLVALFDRDDKYHGRCVEILKDMAEPLVTTWPVLTETFYLLNFSSSVQDDLWVFVERGGLSVAPLEGGLLPRCRVLMKKYCDLPMDMADATLVAIGEEMKLKTVFTLDHKDFRIYRPKHRKKGFILLPAEL